MGNLELAPYIDHTLLKLDATEADVVKLCAEAREFGFKTVCIRANWLSVAGKQLKGTSVLPITVVGFPEGNGSTARKVEETEQAIRWGAQEIDMVINRDWLKQKNYQAVLQDIQSVVRAAGDSPVKVILETSELSQTEKQIACALSVAGGARFVKTSTGFSSGGATAADVRLMRDSVGDKIGVKASGGVRTHKDAIQMIEAGANRLGTSASVAIVTDASAKPEGY